MFDGLRKRLEKRANSPEFIDQFLDEVLAFPFLEVEQGSMFLFDAGRNELVLVASKRKKDSSLLGLTKGLGEGVAGYVAQERKPLLVVSRESSPVAVTQPEGQYETESFISAPIRANGRLIGVLNLTEKKSKKPFNDTDLGIVMSILDQFASNIEQAFQQKDLLERIKCLEQKVQGSQRKAGMGEIVEGVAHEINSGLDAAMRFVRIARQRGEELGDDLLCESLSDARTALERICRIVKPVNQYSRNGKKAAKDTDINEMLDDVLILMSHKLSKHKVRVVKQFQKDLPRVSARSDLDQVVFNIMNNALEAMGPGGTLSLSTALEDGHVAMHFQDTGCGIPEELLSTLGERGVSTKEKGSGIGLSICKDIVEQHGGKMSVSSKVGRGSTFTVRLPLNRQKKGNGIG